MLKHESTIPVASAIGVVTTSNIINYAKYQQISHQSHIIVAGGLTSGVVAGTINYKKYKADEIEKSLAIKNSVKATAQGVVASTATTTAINYIAKRNYLEAFATIGLGAIGVYAVDKVYNTVYKKVIKTDKGEKKDDTETK